MKLSISDKTAKNLQIVVAIVILGAVLWTAVVVTGYLALPLDNVLVFLATLGAIFIITGALMLLRKTDRSTMVGFILLLVGIVFVIVSLLSFYGLLPGGT